MPLAAPRWTRLLPGGPYAAVLVRGASMEPGLRDGDALLVRPGATVRPGDVVVARPVGRPGLLVVKRAVTPLGSGPATTDWELASDDAGAPGALSGPGEVLAVAVARYWPLPPAALRRSAARRSA